jgi:hypothetical protein
MTSQMLKLKPVTIRDLTLLSNMFGLSLVKPAEYFYRHLVCASVRAL